MNEHQIELEWIQEAITDNWQQCFSQSGAIGKKVLEIAVGNGSMRVIANGKLIWTGIQPFSAMEAYNNAFERLRKGDYLDRELTK